MICRNWTALFQKLGGDNEASRMMGKATQSIASHFAAQSQIDAVSGPFWNMHVGICSGVCDEEPRQCCNVPEVLVLAVDLQETCACRFFCVWMHHSYDWKILNTRTGTWPICY